MIISIIILVFMVLFPLGVILYRTRKEKEADLIILRLKGIDTTKGDWPGPS